MGAEPEQDVVSRLSSATAVDARVVVLVEGGSDRRAVEALAARDGRDLEAEGVAIVAMGGATNVGRFVEHFGPRGLGLRLAGLCDAAEEGYVRRGLERAGFGSALSRDDLERLGFFVCVEDLEDELIRALGTARTEEVIEDQGELGMFRTFARQPAQRARTDAQRLRRFMGTRSGRKLRYAPLMVRAAEQDRVPLPLRLLLSGL